MKTQQVVVVGETLEGHSRKREEGVQRRRDVKSEGVLGPAWRLGFRWGAGGEGGADGCGEGLFLTKPWDAFPLPPPRLPGALPAWPAPFSRCAECSLWGGFNEFPAPVKVNRCTCQPACLGWEQRGEERKAGALSLPPRTGNEGTASRQCGSAPGRTSHL